MSTANARILRALKVSRRPDAALHGGLLSFRTACWYCHKHEQSLHDGG